MSSSTQTGGSAQTTSEKLDTMIFVLSTAYENPNQDSPISRPVVRRMLCEVLRLRIERDNSLDDVDVSIRVNEEALADPTSGSRERTEIMYDLSFTMTSRYRITGFASDIDQAIDLGRRAVATAAVTDTQLPYMLDSLGYSLSARYDATRKIEDLDESIDVVKRALGLAPQNSRGHRIFLNNLCARLYKRYCLTSKPEDQSEAIRLAHEVVRITEPASTQRGVALINLSSMLSAKFDRTGFRRDLEEALRVGRLALSALPVGHESRGDMFYNLGSLVKQKYDITKELDDLKEAIQFSEKAVALIPRHSHCREAAVKKRVMLHKEYFGCTDTLDDLHEAIRIVEESLEESPLHFFYVEIAASLWVIEFLRSGSLTSWISFLMHLLNVITTTPVEELNEKLRDQEYRNKTVMKLLCQLGRLGDTALHETIDPIATRILQALREEYGKRSKTRGFVDAVADIVNGCLDVRFDVYRDTATDSLMAESKEILRQAGSFGLDSIRFRYRMLEFTVSLPGKDDDPSEDTASASVSDTPMEKSEVLQKLSKMHERRYSQTRDIEDLDKAIQYCDAALQNIVAGGDSACTTLTQRMAHLWNVKYDTSQDMESLSRAIYYAELVAADKAEGNDQRVANLCNLASLLRWRFVYTAALDDLSRAKQLSENALTFISQDAGSSKLRAMALFTLAMTLKSRYQRMGNVKDLHKCISSAEEAISIDTGSLREDLKATEWMLTNYGLIMRLSYQNTNALSDLDKALQVIRKALDLTSDKSKCIPVLSNMGLILWERYKRTMILDNLHEAIKYNKEALAAATLHGGGRFMAKGGILLNLGNTLVDRYQHTGAVEDLDDAIRYGMEGVKTIPQNHMMAGMGHNDLSETLFSRYKRNHSLKDLNDSIRHGEEAIDITAMDHPLRAYFLLHLGESLAAKMNMRPSEETMQYCIRVHTEAWNCEMARPSDRVDAAWRAGKYLLQDKRHNEAAEMLENAVQILPNLSPRWVERSDQQHRLSLYSGLAADAALAVLQAGRDSQHALRLLELGRGVMMGVLMDHRGQISHSENDDVYPELLREFNLLRMKVDAMDPKAMQQRDQGGSTNPRETVEEMERMLKDIRRLPGHEDFLQPPKPENIMAMAADGPIVVVSTSSIVESSMAIIARSSGISSLLLPKLTHTEVNVRMNHLVGGILKGSLKTFATRNEKMCDLLLWLWEVVVEPVLGELGFLEDTAPGSPLPRVRWIGVGLLSHAPFHAAGDNSPGSKRNTMSRVVSSYLPNLRALAFARERKPKKYLHTRHEASVLVVLMPETPGAAPLPSAEGEADDILNIAAANSMQGTMLKLPTAAAVLEQLPLNNIVHFACHGVSDRADPSDSHLMLTDAKLTVQQILRIHAAEPDLAFLAACSTAQSHDTQLADESVHIASSFQMVGFRHVVGTLWTAVDDTCGEIAHSFYDKLLAESGNEWDGTWKVAESLHFAVSTVRAREYDSPLLWAPFVPFGG